MTVSDEPAPESTGWASIPNWLLRDPSVSPHAKLLYMALSSRAGRSGVCWPSQQFLSAEIGLSESTLKRALKVLMDLGVVSVRVVATPRGRRNEYLIGAHQGSGHTDLTPQQGGGGSGHTDLTGQVTQTSEEEPVEEEPTPTTTPTTSPTTSNVRERRGRMTNSWKPSVEATNQGMAACTHVDFASATMQFKGWYIGTPSRNAERTQSEWDGLWLAWIARREEQWADRQAAADNEKFDPVTGLPKTWGKKDAVYPTMSLTTGQSDQGEREDRS